MNDSTPTEASTSGTVSTASRAVSFPNLYAWLVLFAALDGMLTWGVLVLGGREVNPVAAAVLDRFGFFGMIGFKFAIITAVILVCEFIARHDRRTAKQLALVGVVLNVLPVAWTLMLLRGA